MRRLLDRDPSLATTPGPNGPPPLHAATTPQVAELLLDHGASLETVDSMGNSPLASAISRGEHASGVAALLLERGASTTPCGLAALGRTRQLEELLDADGSALCFVGNIGLNAVLATPLHAAVAADQEDTVRMLLERQADPNARADMGQTPLHLARSATIGQLLIDSGADPSAVDDEHETTPLTCPRRHRHPRRQ